MPCSLFPTLLRDRDMTHRFFAQPIINSPYEYPRRHPAKFVTPIPKPRKRKGACPSG